MEIDNLKLLKATVEAASEIKTLELGPRGTVELALVPEGYTLKDLDKYAKQPRRLEQKQNFATVEAFATYVKAWGHTNVIMRGFLSNGNITATLDYHAAPSEPSWCGHVATLSSDITPEWKVWKDHEKDRFTQRIFLHFIEDNAEDIEEPALAELIGTIKDVKIGNQGGRKSSVSSTVEDQSQNRRVEIESGLPDSIMLSLRPWRHAHKYAVKARPFLHADETGIQFSYHLINLDRVLEKAFNDIVEEVAKLTDRQVLI